MDLFRKADLNLILDVKGRLATECMTAAGYPQLEQGPQILAVPMFRHLDVAARSWGPTTEDEARRYGLGEPAPAEPPRVVSFDPAFDAAHERCVTSALEKLGAASAEVTEQYIQLGNDLSSGLSDKLNPVAKEIYIPGILNCMRGRGYGVTDDGRDWVEQIGLKKGALENEVMWEPERRPGTVEVGPPVPRREYIPTREEVEYAVANVHCKHQTGFFQRIDESIDAAQRAVVEQHAVQFAELNPKIEAMAKEAAKAVGR